MSVVISDETLQAANISASELLQEIAVLLFQRNRLTLGQASALAELDQLSFMRLLGSRNIPIHYDEQDFDADLATLRALGEL
jgi:predicted HTH domain antitoxin